MARKMPDYLEQAIATYEPRVRREFLLAWSSLRNSAKISALESAIASGDHQRVIGVLSLDRAAFGALEDSIIQSYNAGGRGLVGALPPIDDPENGGRLRVNFDARHPRAEAWATENGGRFITEITDDQRKSIQEHVRRSLVDGRNPRNAALDIVGRVDRTTGRRSGGVLGLHSSQAQSVTRMRDDLTSGDPKRMRSFFDKKLRPKNLDSVVSKAMREGKPLTVDEANKATMGYSRNLLRHRGEVVARTEALDALRAGRHEGVTQLEESGKVQEEQISRYWDSTGDSRTRPDHLEMEGQMVTGAKTPFVLPDGSKVLHPGDGSLGASPQQVIQCRCVERIRISYIRPDGKTYQSGII